MSEFATALTGFYRIAEQHPRFFRRVPDADATSQPEALGYDMQISATVSVWTDIDAPNAHAVTGDRGKFLERSREWFEAGAGPQLDIWSVHPTERPTFSEAFDRLYHLKEHGPSDSGYG